MSYKKAILLTYLIAMDLGIAQAQVSAATTQPKDYRKMPKADSPRHPFDDFKAPTAWGFDMKKVEEHAKERGVQVYFQDIVKYRDIKRQIEQLNKEKAEEIRLIGVMNEAMKQQFDHDTGMNASKKEGIKRNNKTQENMRKAKIVEIDKKIAEHQAQLDKLMSNITNPTHLTVDQVAKIPTH